MSDVPTLKEEVERKALETLEMIARDHEVGKITEAQYGYALTVLWGACAGLAGSDFTVFMEVAAKARQNGSQYSHVFFRNDKGDIAKVSNFHDAQVRYEIIKADGRSASKSFDFRTVEWGYTKAKDKFRDLCDTMVTSGFTEI